MSKKEGWPAPVGLSPADLIRLDQVQRGEPVGQGDLPDDVYAAGLPRVAAGRSGDVVRLPWTPDDLGKEVAVYPLRVTGTLHDDGTVHLPGGGRLVATRSPHVILSGTSMQFTELK